MSLIAIRPRIDLASSFAPCRITATGVFALVKNLFSTATNLDRASFASAFWTASSRASGVLSSPCSSNIRASVRSFNSSLYGFNSASARTSWSPLSMPNISAARSGASPSFVIIPCSLVRSTAGVKPVVLVGYMFMTVDRSNLLPTRNSTSLPSASSILPVRRNRSAFRTGSFDIFSASSDCVCFLKALCAVCISFKIFPRAPDNHSICLTLAAVRSVTATS